MVLPEIRKNVRKNGLADRLRNKVNKERRVRPAEGLRDKVQRNSTEHRRPLPLKVQQAIQQYRSTGNRFNLMNLHKVIREHSLTPHQKNNIFYTNLEKF